MVWIIIGDASYQIIGCNIAQSSKETGKYDLWITRPTGKTLRIIESVSWEKATEAKNAIDYAVENNITTLEF